MGLTKQCNTSNDFSCESFIENCRCNGKTLASYKFYKDIVHKQGYIEPSIPKIKKVIFNDPATIVLWKDGTKTVVKCQDGDIFDEEKGLAMAISKKVLGNDYSYYNVFKKYCKNEPDRTELYADGELYSKIFNNLSLIKKYIGEGVNLTMDKGDQHGK